MKAAETPRRSTGPEEQSTCGERMRSPAPSQRLQVTGGILEFAIYQGTVVWLETRRWKTSFFFFSINVICSGFHALPTSSTCIYQTVKSEILEFSGSLKISGGSTGFFSWLGADHR